MLRTFGPTLILLCSITLSIGVPFWDNHNVWLARINNSDLEAAEHLGQQLGYRLVKRVTGFDDVFVFTEFHNNGKRAYLPPKILNNDKRVKWADQQTVLTRVKRDHPAPPSSNELLRHQWLRNRIASMMSSDFMTEHHRQTYGSQMKQADVPIFNDELWNQEWYLQDTRQRHGLPRLDLNVLPVYEKGYSGKGVRVAVLDDGIEYWHDDLWENFDPEISWDCNHDRADPSPGIYDDLHAHGTRCAGEIAMVANNGKCGVGVAHGCKIGGLKILDGQVYDLIEGMALGYAHKLIDIYSSSWGPTDNGATLEGPRILAEHAIRRGIQEGRGGRGSIYVWASGNGGTYLDNCNCDGYASSIYTITVGSASQRGQMPWYSEMCPAIMTVTYSSGAYTDQMITTTDLNNSCTVKHTGTSASAPLAAGIIALGLEANKELTWRDVQHLIVRTSEHSPLIDNEGWQRNAVGLMYNIRFGFGLMNADAFVTAALSWSNVPPQQMDTVTDVHQHVIGMTSGVAVKSAKLMFQYDGDIKYLEHVAIKINMKYTHRGAIEMYLTSPSGTKIQLLSKRPLDLSADGFSEWKLMSVATWGEDPRGIWKLLVIDDMSLQKLNFGYISNCSLIIYGTEEDHPYSDELKLLE